MRGVSLWRAEEIAAACGGAAKGSWEASAVTFDSREVEFGSLFIALKGERADGHDYVPRALEAGATGVLVSRGNQLNSVVVDDTTAALEALGRAGRERLAPIARVIGVTGSVGKTGTKEALAAALARGLPGEARAVHRSVKSYNNHTGVPLSLARCPADARFAVLEMGMNHAGELAALTKLVRPHVAIVTAIAAAHRAFFSSEEAIADAKGEIFRGLVPNGTAILPEDSPHRDRLRTAAEPYAEQVWTFGRGRGATVRAREVVASPNGGSLVTATLPGADLTFSISQPGEHWVSNALAVVAAVAAAGGDLAAAGLALAELPGLKGRGERHRVALPDGGELLLIDESYNANPGSMAATLKVLGDEPAARRIAVLGAMREMGEESDRYHAELAGPVARAQVSLAVLVGPEMAPLARALRPDVATLHVRDAAEAEAALAKEVRAGDVLLVKGSNGVGLSKVVDAMLRPAGAGAGSVA